jgi:hypothetical protein
MVFGPSLATWFHHLHRASDEEAKAAIQTTGLSDAFRTAHARPAAGPLSKLDNDSDEEWPQKCACEADIEHYGKNIQYSLVSNH